MLDLLRQQQRKEVAEEIRKCIGLLNHYLVVAAELNMQVNIENNRLREMGSDIEVSNFYAKMYTKENF